MKRPHATLSHTSGMMISTAGDVEISVDTAVEYENATRHALDERHGANQVIVYHPNTRLTRLRARSSRPFVDDYGVLRPSAVVGHVIVFRNGELTVLFVFDDDREFVDLIS